MLLRSYFAAFDGQSDVTLVLKTFPNPHNQVAGLLADLRSGHADPPDVRWIDRDLDDGEIEGLYGLADCYVHPARGEGFGLPVAEAMAAGIPVITVAYSGLADFVSEETAVTIPYRLEPAETHLSIAGSVWAEPDGDQLTIEMQRMVADPGRGDLLERVDRARRLIATEYSWDASVRRWEEFIADLEGNEVPLRVAMVSTWNSRCGIAENTRYIVDQSKGSLEFDLFADVGAEVIDPLVEPGTVRAWESRWEPDLEELADALRLTEAGVVHIQFNFGFFELQRMAALIERQLEQRGVVVTLHRTRDIMVDGESLSLGQIRSTLEKVDRVIVHQPSDVRALAELGLGANVSLIPVGASPPPDLSPAEVRDALRLGSRPWSGPSGSSFPTRAPSSWCGRSTPCGRNSPTSSCWDSARGTRSMSPTSTSNSSARRSPPGAWRTT